jgi:uncharacterized protein YbjT (DUF2867 family)
MDRLLAAHLSRRLTFSSARAHNPGFFFRLARVMPAKSSAKALVKSRSAILLGATGLVRSHCLHRLLESADYDQVIAVSRRPLKQAHEWPDKLQVIEVPSFDRLGGALQNVAARDVYCCLGTTIRQAGTKAEFHKVDYGYALEFAHQMRANGAQHFLLVSALGADARSPIFYNRVKGLLERDIAALNYPRLSIFRPSFLVGESGEKRLGEALGLRFAKVISPFLRGPLAAMHPIGGADVAFAMMAAATKPAVEKTNIYSYADMQALLV